MSASTISGVWRLYGWLLNAASFACWASSAALLHPAVRSRVAAWAAAVDSAEPARVRRAVWLSGAVVAFGVCLHKACQYWALALTTDSAVMVNTAANVIAGNGLASTLDGTPSALSVHFAFLVPVLFGPLLWLCRSPLPFVLIQAAAVASAGPAAYLLAQRRTDSRFLGLVAMGLAWSHPSFRDLVTADVENSVFVAPLLLWGLVLLDAEAYGWAGLCALLALATREQFPFAMAGLGLYHALASGRPRRRRWLEGGAIVAGAAAIWGLEMRVVGSYSHSINTEGYWAMYSRFGSTRAEVVRTVLTRPDRVLWAIVWPPSHLLPLVRLLAGAAFLPLAAPAAMVFLLVSMVHNLLQTTMYIYLQNAAYSYGPLVFATACGLGAVGRRPLVLASALLAAGWGLHRPSGPAAGFFLALYPEAPALLDRVPDGASVWTEDYLAARSSARTQLKSFNIVLVRPRFDSMLFRPEYVLVDKLALIALSPPEYRRRVVGFLARAGYMKEAEGGPLVLLRDPQAPRGGPSPALALGDAPEDAARLDAYVASVLDSPEARQRLAAYPPALRYEPRSAEGHAVFALALAERGLTDLAAAHYEAALNAQPDYVEAHSNLASLLLTRGDLPGAERHLRAAAAERPGDGLIAYNLGNVLIMERNAAEAVPILEAAARALPDNARVSNSLGAAYMLARRDDDARRALRRALTLDPGLAQAGENLRRLGP